MRLAFGLTFQDLHTIDGLRKLDRLFMDFLHDFDGNLALVLNQFRSTPHKVHRQEYSELLIKSASLLDDFLAVLFAIEPEVHKTRLSHQEFDIIYECKRKFVQRYALRKYPKGSISQAEFIGLCRPYGSGSPEILNLFEDAAAFDEANFAKTVMHWYVENLRDNSRFANELEAAARFAAYMVYNSKDKGVLFELPETIDKDNLINAARVEKCREHVRIGFDYFEPDLNLNNSLNHAHYCIYCHKQDKDSCSKGLDAHNHGCPLKQKISEMNYVKARGYNLAALAIIMIDNPMVAATGHRVCNDCMKSCIYQKQEPVNIPIVESDILTGVLNLPYGTEIYLLLTRWNPLNIHDSLPKPSTGYNVLVAGLGPAGFGLAHYLLNEGHNVVAIDAVKIKPLPFDIWQPIKNWHEHKTALRKRIPHGFGGVAEYGITSRWDKNNLEILRLILARRQNFKLYDEVKFGEDITIEQSFDLGFDHVALCTGAGMARLPGVQNLSSRGVKTALGFLTSLQSDGAFLEDSQTDLVIRMPIAIIGCGLTALDVAVEALNYYPVMVEKFLRTLEQGIEKKSGAEDKAAAEEFIEHAQLFRLQKDKKRIRQILLNDLGGATIYYRGALKNSPAYRQNHEEVIQAIAAGVKFVENMNLIRINSDKHNNVQSITCKQSGDKKESTFTARSVLIALGTESPYRHIRHPEFIGTHETLNLFQGDVTLFGDCDPGFAGSVVKALASSKAGYKDITARMSLSSPRSKVTDVMLKLFQHLGRMDSSP